MATTIALAREQACFFVPETTPGTLVFPSDLTNQFILAAGVAAMNQQPTFSDSEEILDTLDVIDRFQDALPAGSWSLAMYLRPAGAAGSKPMGAGLFKALMGVETVNASTSVVYTQAKGKPCGSLWFKRGHTVFFAKGCAVTGCKITFNNKGAIKAEFSGGLMHRGWAGTSALATAITTSGVTSVVVDNAKLFSVGARIYNKTKGYDNSDAGWEVTAVDLATDTLTVSPAIDGTTDDWEAGDLVAGYLPAGTAIGTPLESRNNVITLGGDTVSLRSVEIDNKSPVAYTEDEMNGVGYPIEYIEDMRSIDISLSAYFRRDMLAYLRDAMDNTQVAVVATCGNVSGKQVVFSLPYCSFEVPEPGTNSPGIDMTIKAKALGSSGEDSLSITFQ